VVGVAKVAKAERAAKIQTIPARQVNPQAKVAATSQSERGSSESSLFFLFFSPRFKVSVRRNHDIDSKPRVVSNTSPMTPLALFYKEKRRNIL